MGHSAHYADYEENVKRSSVQEHWDHVASMDDWQEGSSGLAQPIRWIESVLCTDRDEAEKFIQDHDRGWYDQLAVRYRSYPESGSKSLQNFETRLLDVKRKHIELKNKIHYQGVKSEFIGCRYCGSKINANYLAEKLKTNFCPVCYMDMRPASTLERIENLHNAVEKLQKEYNAALKKENERTLKKSVIRWLVKTEYHT